MNKCCDIVIKNIETIKEIGQEITRDRLLDIIEILSGWQKLENRCKWCLSVEKGFDKYFKGDIKTKEEAKEFMEKEMNEKHSPKLLEFSNKIDIILLAHEKVHDCDLPTCPLLFDQVKKEGKSYYGWENKTFLPKYEKMIDNQVKQWIIDTLEKLKENEK